jgi:hypothetical protein
LSAGTLPISKACDHSFASLLEAETRTSLAPSDEWSWRAALDDEYVLIRQAPQRDRLRR